MKFIFGPEIYTDTFEATVQFYQSCFGFTERAAASNFQTMEGFTVMTHNDNPHCILYICKADSPNVDKLFWPSFHGGGLIFQIEVDDATSVYTTVQKYGAPVALAMTEEPGNGKHFAVKDPNGILIDVTELKNEWL